ncbi:MAG: LysE family translocator [Shimia sp.]
MSAALFATLVGVHLLAVVSPGPSFVVAVRVAVTRGAGAAAVLSLGFGVGAAFWAGAALLGLAALFAVAPILLTGFKIAGGLFLAFIGLMMWRHARAPLPQADATARPPFLLGLFTALANPKIAVFFGAVFAGLLPVGLSTGDIALVLAAVAAVEAAWYMLVGMAFAAPRARAVYARAKVYVDRVFGGLLAAMGARIMVG